MKLTEASLRNPAAVAAAVYMVCVFGLTSLFDLPLQLFPDIERPQMSIQTYWRSASPQEIESEIVEPIESVMQGLPGLEEISSNISAGNSWLSLTFAVGSDMDATLVEVLSRMNRLSPLPRDANPPVVRSGGFNAGDTLTFFFVQKLPDAPGSVHDDRKLIEDRIVPRLSAIDGVAGVEIQGNDADELTIAVDPQRAAALGIQIPEIAALAARATDVSGGSVEVGRREYVLRFAGRYSPEALGGLILAWRDAPTGAAGRCRARRSTTSDERRGRLPERQSRHWPARHARERRQRACDAGRGDRDRRHAARGRTACAGARHPPELRLGHLHPSRDPVALRKPVRRPGAGSRLPVVVPARCACHRADRLRDPDLDPGDLHRAQVHRPQPQRDLAGGVSRSRWGW